MPMRTFLLVLFSLLLGVGLGAGVAVWRIQVAPWDPTLDEGNRPTATALPGTGEPVPKVVVEQTKFDFGTLDLQEKEKRSHQFTFANDGNAPLTLTRGGTSCRCTVSEVEKEQVSPGESSKVTLSWQPTGEPGPFQYTAKILTNDPAQPKVTLTISGKITAVMRASPAELVFTQVSAGEPSTATARLFGYLDQPLKILDHKWSDPAISKYFAVEFQPLSAGDFKDDPLAKSGVLARITVKPGLPQGPFRQKIVLQTNLGSPAELTLPVQGTVGSDIAIVGHGWDTESGTLNLGAVRSSAGRQARLILVVRGPHRKEVKFKPITAVPGLLKVRLGATSEINNGAVVQTPLIIDIPPGSPPANHLGSQQGQLGEIVIETTHPQVHELRILVRFAIEG